MYEHDLYHKAILFLYGFQLQKYFDIVPIFCKLTEADDFVECEDFIVHNGKDLNTLYMLRKTGKVVLSLDNSLIPKDLQRQYKDIMDFIQERKEVLTSFDTPIRQESWETIDYGYFKIWEGRIKKILLYSSGGKTFGYTVVEEREDDMYIVKSKSVKEDGYAILSGKYKRNEHQLKGRKFLNLDLIDEDGNVGLLRFQPSGPGYKVFKRKVPE